MKPPAGIPSYELESVMIELSLRQRLNHEADARSINANTIARAMPASADVATHETRACDFDSFL